MELPADAIGKILIAMVKQYPFDTAGEAGRSLLNCGLVNKTWREAATREAVWRALYLRCSPAHVRARDGLMPVPRDSDDAADENSYYRHQDFHETVSSTLTRSRYFADSIVSPYVRPRVPNVPSFRDLFRSRYLAAHHAATAYHVSGTTIAAPQLHHTNGAQHRIVPKYTCATVVADDESPPAVDLKEISFVFELFGDVELYAGHIVTDSLRDKDVGQPHFACHDDKDLLWASTVRASEDGLVQALVPLDDQGRLVLTHSVPVDLGDIINHWCQSWRLVVTAVRDDGKMCQIIDIRDKNQFQGGFRDEGDQGGSCYFRVAELGGDSESLECKVHFGVNARCGPASQGYVHRYNMVGCNAACSAYCARRHGELGDAVDARGVYLVEPYWMYDNQAQREYRAFRECEDAVDPGEMFQITISWLYFNGGETWFPDGTHLDGTLAERLTAFPGSTTARRLNNPGYSRVPDDDEPFVEHVRMVESKLARLNWL